MASVLYISYDGVLEPLGQSQVLGYLCNLAKDHEITLLSYEKRESWQDVAARKPIQAEVENAGIRWIALRYHQRPTLLATAYDLTAGCLIALYLALRHGVTITHARSYVASIPALLVKKLYGSKFIFDMRGFWADERVERAGLKKAGRTYRVVKWFERRFFSNADVVVSLTHAGVRTIEELPYLQGRTPICRVIPTCTDLHAFSVPLEREAEPFTLGYVGSADLAYLFEPVLRCFKVLSTLRPGARLLVVTRTPHRKLHEFLVAFGISEKCVEIKSVPHDAVPLEMARMHAGIFFVKPGFSARGSVPTKLGEFLACGVPCLGNAGIGDLDSLLEGEEVGVILREFTSQAEAAAVKRLLELAGEAGVRKRCLDVARKVFSLENGVKSYDEIYRSLAG